MRGNHAVAAMAAILIATTTAGADTLGPLHKAAFAGDAEFVKTWIAQKRNLDVTYDEPARSLEGNYARSRGVTGVDVRSLSNEERSRLSILPTCCSRTPHTATQARICKLFGM